MCVSVISAYQVSPPDTCPLLTALFVLDLTQEEAVDASESMSTTQEECKRTIETSWFPSPSISLEINTRLYWGLRVLAVASLHY